MADVSVLIPSRNEIFLPETLADILSHARADTEIIVIADGDWPDPPIEDDPRVTLVMHGTAIGQRAATNEAARLARGAFVMKLDAHCAVDDGFDVKLMQPYLDHELGPDVTTIPAQKNLHVFNRVCSACGFRTYQGPLTLPCEKCKAQGTYQRELVWKPRRGTTTMAWRFDTDLHFQYDGPAQKRQVGDLCDVMTSLGACFFMRRDRFFDLGGLDEAAGIWGQFGVEIACKSWLSGGRQVVNKRTWYAHMFRTQGLDFGFPYDLSGRAIEAARTYSQDLWLRHRWPGATRRLSWILDHFWPIEGWTEADRERVRASEQEVMA